MEYKFNMEEEVICDHLVTAQMKQIWAVQLRMVSKFAEVCERHNLKWFASGGTLIGAVRHKGYIPWDDDIDIHMLAEDYDKFCQVAPEEMKPYFWQDFHTQPGFGPRHGKVRDANTTGATNWEILNWPASMNKGIFIDIFPLHYIPADKKVRKAQIKRLMALRDLIALYHWIRFETINPEVDAKVERNLYHKLRYGLGSCYRFYKYRHFCKRTESELSQEYYDVCGIQKEPTEYVGATTFDPEESRFVWPARNYREMVDLPFMGGTIKAPIEWDACLRQQYGDYMVIRKGGEMHTTITFDVNTPYTEKLPGLPEYQEKH